VSPHLVIYFPLLLYRLSTLLFKRALPQPRVPALQILLLLSGVHASTFSPLDDFYEKTQLTKLPLPPPSECVDLWNFSSLPRPAPLRPGAPSFGERGSKYCLQTTGAYRIVIVSMPSLQAGNLMSRLRRDISTVLTTQLASH